MMTDSKTMTPDKERQPYQALLASNVKVVNVGLEGFVKDLRDCNIGVVHVDWRPSAGGDPEMAALLAKLGV
jgi:hypothetical protein